MRIIKFSLPFGVLVCIMSFMKKKLFYYVVCCLFFVIISSSFAQEVLYDLPSHESSPSQEYPKWRTSIEDVKTKLSVLVAENDNLTAEYYSLSSRLAVLRKAADSYKNQGKKISNSIDIFKEVKQRKIALTEDMSGLGHKQKILRLQIADYELQKSDLEAKIKKSLDKQQGESLSDEQLDKLFSLEESLQKSLNQEQQISKEIAKVEQMKPVPEEEMYSLEILSQKLMSEIAALEKVRDEQFKKNTALTNRTLKFIKKTEKEFLERVEKKVALEVDIEDIEKNFLQKDEIVEVFADWQIARKTLLDQLINLDEENQRLRKKIAELEHNIKSLRSEKGYFKKLVPIQGRRLRVN